MRWASRPGPTSFAPGRPRATSAKATVGAGCVTPCGPSPRPPRSSSATCPSRGSTSRWRQGGLARAWQPMPQRGRGLRSCPSRSSARQAHFSRRSTRTPGGLHHDGATRDGRLLPDGHRATPAISLRRTPGQLRGLVPGPEGRDAGERYAGGGSERRRLRARSRRHRDRHGDGGRGRRADRQRRGVGMDTDGSRVATTMTNTSGVYTTSRAIPSGTYYSPRGGRTTSPLYAGVNCGMSVRR